ncbi:unnamed protein product [Staurois parvus]|uniref:Uncharacterized protein n=1 Tax=Staurois parvus TaxID=386267 RepID=A0ABN9CWP1_9NEOB|nr:unnamed protein product [Staurois parvus]
MYINGRPGAVQERLALYKCPPAFTACARSLEITWYRNRCMGPLCEVLIM